MRLCSGKYEFYVDRDNHALFCKRHGQDWRDFVGDKAVRALFDYAEELEKRIESLEEQIETERGNYQEMINR